MDWSFWKNGGLWACYLSILIYYLLALRDFRRQEISVDAGTQLWLKGLLIITGMLMLAYSPALFHYVGYAGGGLLYTLAILCTGYIMVSTKGKISFFRTKYESSSLKKEQLTKMRDQLT